MSVTGAHDAFHDALVPSLLALLSIFTGHVHEYWVHVLTTVRCSLTNALSILRCAISFLEVTRYSVLESGQKLPVLVSSFLHSWLTMLRLIKKSTFFHDPLPHESRYSHGEQTRTRSVATSERRQR